MKRRLLLLSLALCALAGGLTAGEFNKSGRTAMQFLKIGVGARQTALGEAGISLVRDMNAVFWNPAGISGVNTWEASFSYSRWIGDLNYLAGAAGVRLPGIGVFGLGVASLNYGDIPEALAAQVGGSSDTRTGRTFTGGDFLASLTFAREFTDRLTIGVTAKYLRENLYSYSADGYALDFGTFYDTGFNGIRFAMSFQNFGKSVTFLDRPEVEEEGFDIPLIFRVGASVDLIKAGESLIDLGDMHLLTLAFEAVNTNDFGDRYHVGGEYTLAGLLVLRGGYRFNYAEGNLSFGAGLQKDFGDLTARVDFSYVTYEFLDSPYRITVSIGY